jgi:hypothetical protein
MQSAQSARHHQADLLRPLVEELDDVTAAIANELVLIASVVDDLIAPLVIVRVEIIHQFAFFELPLRAVNRGFAEVGIDLLDLGGEIFRVDMPTGLEEYQGNVIALTPEIEPCLRKIVIRSCALLRIRSHAAVRFIFSPIRGIQILRRCGKAYPAASIRKCRNVPAMSEAN